MFFFKVINLRYKSYTNFNKFLLLLSGDVSLNPGLIQSSPDVSSTIREPLNKKGVHSLDININSLHSKTDGIRFIANKSEAAIIGITESNLDYTIPNSEINFPVYDILQCDRNRNDGRKYLCFNTKTLHCKEIANLVFDILLPMQKPITIGVFYRPPNQAEFMDLMIEKLANLNLRDNEIYLLGDFYINIFQNSKYILNGKRSSISQGSFYSMINRCKKFCPIHTLKQLIRCPTRVTCNTSILIDHILTSSAEKSFDCGISDHQLIFCTRKVKQLKFHKHKNLLLRSLKHYTVNLFCGRFAKSKFFKL